MIDDLDQHVGYDGDDGVGGGGGAGGGDDTFSLINFFTPFSAIPFNTPSTPFLFFFF